MRLIWRRIEYTILAWLNVVCASLCRIRYGKLSCMSERWNGSFLYKVLSRRLNRKSRLRFLKPRLAGLMMMGNFIFMRYHFLFLTEKFALGFLHDFLILDFCSWLIESSVWLRYLCRERSWTQLLSSALLLHLIVLWQFL